MSTEKKNPKTLFQNDIYRERGDSRFHVWNEPAYPNGFFVGAEWPGEVVCRAENRADAPDPKAGRLYKGDLYRDHTSPDVVQEWKGSEGYTHSLGTILVCRAADRENYLTPPAPATETKSERAKRHGHGYFGVDFGLGRDFWSFAPCYIHDERIVFEPKPLSHAPERIQEIRREVQNEIQRQGLVSKSEVRRMIDEALYAARIVPHSDGSLHVHDWGTGSGVKSKESSAHFAKAASEVVRIGTPKVPTVEDLTKQVETLKLELEAARAHANGGAR